MHFQIVLTFEHVADFGWVAFSEFGGGSWRIIIEEEEEEEEEDIIAVKLSPLTTMSGGLTKDVINNSYYRNSLKTSVIKILISLILE